MSETKKIEIGIHVKLMLARTEIKSGKDARNNFGGYDFRNAETMLANIKPVLARHGLTVDFSDDIVQIGDRYYVKTTTTVYDTESGEKHSTTQFAREAAEKKGMDAAQVTGAAMTYAHKYGLMGLLSISDPKMDPDAHDNRPAPAPGPTPPAPTPAPVPAPAPAQYRPAPAPAPAQYQPAPTQYGQQTRQYQAGYQTGGFLKNR